VVDLENGEGVIPGNLFFQICNMWQLTPKGEADYGRQALIFGNECAHPRSAI
jgi:hypothetical protein